MESVLLDVAGHRRSHATVPGYHRGRPPRNKGEQYPADPPTVEEIVAVMSAVGERADGRRLRALIVLLWRGGTADHRNALAPRERPRPHPRRCTGPAWEGRQAPRGRDGPLGMGPARPLARDPPRASDRRGAVRDPRTDGRTTLGSIGRAQTAASRGRGRRRETTLRATPTPARARGRDGARRRPARRDPAATRTRAPRHHEHLPAGNRQQRNHRHRPRTTGSDDLRQRRSPDEAIDQSAARIGSAFAGPTRRHTPGWRIGGRNPCRRSVPRCTAAGLTATCPFSPRESECSADGSTATQLCRSNGRVARAWMRSAVDRGLRHQGLRPISRCSGHRS